MHNQKGKKGLVSHDSSKKTGTGFTLIELLIVVAIVGLLASTILVGLGTFRQTGRDARRIIDLRQIQNGLEIYFQLCGFYPGTGDCVDTTASTFQEMSDAIINADLDIRQIPNDPLPTGTYYYARLANGSLDDGKKYILAAVLEDSQNPQLRQDLDDEDVDIFDYQGDLVSDLGGCGTSVEDRIYCIEL
jgi:prepilin-type N-terminal cleavage/methylation domain-containing protein